MQHRIFLPILCLQYLTNMNVFVFAFHTSKRLRKGRGTREQIANIHWIIEKAKEFQKKSTSASLTTLKLLTVWITTNWKIPQEMRIPLPDS